MTEALPYPRPGNGEGARRARAKDADRDLDIWRAYCDGLTQTAIGRRFNLDQSTVSRIIDRVRDSIPQEDRAAMVRRQVEFLLNMQAEMMVDFHEPLPPAFDKDGNILVDENGQVVRDKTGRFAAWDRAVRSARELAKLLGLDAPTRQEIAVAQVTYVLVDVDDQSLK